MTPDPEIDFSKVDHIHLIAIGGVAMTSLAGMLRARGFTVTGSDVGVYPPASDLLARLGVPVREGYGAENLTPRPDLVVVGNAVSRTNPEVVAMLELDLPYVSMPEALRRLLLVGKRSLVVAGTHGKSTSTSMLWWMLEKAGRAPSMMVGAEAIDLGGNFRLGAGEDFVLEGDEYDTAFFDKGPKFLHYETQALVLGTIEFDHADIYRDLDHVLGSFVALLEGLPAGAPVVASADSENTAEALRRAGRTAETFGVAEHAFWWATNVRDEAGRTCFAIHRDGREEIELRLGLMGEINVRNATGVYALGRRLGLEPEELRPGLESARGVRRRQEVVADGPIVVLDDFAHHPTAIAGTIAAVRARYPERRLWAVFEPRSNTSRRRVFEEAFPEALRGADRVVVAAVFFKESDPLPEAERLRIDVVLDRLRSHGVEAETLPDPDAVLGHLERETATGDVVVFMSNGAFGGLPRRFAARIADRSTGTGAT